VTATAMPLVLTRGHGSRTRARAYAIRKFGALASSRLAPMKLGVFTVLFADLSFAQMLDRVASLGIEAVELGTGNYPGNAHCDPGELRGDAAA
jgi:hypothetical protein